MTEKAKIKEWLVKGSDFLDRVLEYLREKLPFLKGWSPTFAPTTWIFINGTCCLLTAMFFMMGLLPEKSYGFKFAELWYIPYNLAICIIWFFEAALWMLFDEETKAWHKLGELGLAIFFVLDGVVYLYEWKFMGVPVEAREILIYTAIDFVIYLFYLIHSIREESKKSLRDANGLSKNGIDKDIECATVATTETATEPKEAKACFKLMK